MRPVIFGRQVCGFGQFPRLVYDSTVCLMHVLSPSIGVTRYNLGIVSDKGQGPADPVAEFLEAYERVGRIEFWLSHTSAFRFHCAFKGDGIVECVGRQIPHGFAHGRKYFSIQGAHHSDNFRGKRGEPRVSTRRDSINIFDRCAHVNEGLDHFGKDRPRHCSPTKGVVDQSDGERRYHANNSGNKCTCQKVKRGTFKHGCDFASKNPIRQDA